MALSVDTINLHNASVFGSLDERSACICQTEGETMSLDIESQLKKIVVNQLGVEEAAVVSKAKFIEDLGADSLDIVELVMAMEESFSVDIPDEEAESIRTVEDAVNYIKKAKEA
jgi:acyl carrier protein